MYGGHAVPSRLAADRDVTGANEEPLVANDELIEAQTND